MIFGLDRYYTIKARFAWQTESQSTGNLCIEDRIVAVEAHSETEAIKFAMREFKSYGAPSMQSDGYFHRMHFQEIIEIYDMVETPLNPKGSEVFTELKKRRMKPEYEWHPTRE